MKSVRFRIDGREGLLAVVLGQVANPSGWVREALRAYIAQGFNLAEKERTVRVTLREGRDDTIIHTLEMLRSYDESQARLIRAACAWQLGRRAQLDVVEVACQVVRLLRNEGVVTECAGKTGESTTADAFVAGLFEV